MGFDYYTTECEKHVSISKKVKKLSFDHNKWENLYVFVCLLLIHSETAGEIWIKFITKIVYDLK